MEKKELLLGNEAIAGAVVAAGCQVATAYPGTPSSEILPAIARFAGARFTVISELVTAAAAIKLIASIGSSLG